MNIIIFLGPPGSGKGTQIKYFSQKYKYPIISPGKIFRNMCLQGDSGVCEEILRCIKSGELVSDVLVNKVVREEFEKNNQSWGVILDGYPRDLVQLEALESIQPTISDIKMVAIELPRVEALERRNGRRVCLCGDSYHLVYNPPLKEGVCNTCGKELIIRNDDEVGVINKRFDSYEKDTLEVMRVFEKQGNLVKINGSQGIAKIWESIENAFK